MRFENFFCSLDDIKAPSTPIRFHLKRIFSLGICLSSTCTPVSDENSHRKRSPEWNFLKIPIFCFRVDGENWNFSKTMTYQHGIQPTRTKEKGGK